MERGVGVLRVLEGCEGCAASSHPFLARLQKEALGALTLLHSQREVARGDALFRQGEPAEEIYCVSNAVVRLSTLGRAGRRSVVGVVGGGGMVGLSAALHPDARHTCDAEVTVGGALCSFKRADLVALNAAHPELGLVLCGEVAREAERGVRQAATLTEPRLETRLAAVLLELAIARPGRASIVADGLSRSDLAGLCGVGREAVARMLSKWRKAGLLSTAGGPITLRDEAALRALVEGG